MNFRLAARHRPGKELNNTLKRRFAICIDNTDFAASLIVKKITSNLECYLKELEQGYLHNATEV